MKKSNFSLVKLLCAAVFVVSVLALTGCNLGGKFSAELEGTWKASEFEQYVITKNTFESVGTYKGDSLTVVQDSDSSGTIFVKYSEIPDWTKGQLDEPDDTTGWTEVWGMWYPANEALLGKWYAISYKELTDTSVKLSGAFKANGKSCTETLKEAKEEFTIENGYFDFYSECIK